MHLIILVFFFTDIEVRPYYGIVPALLLGQAPYNLCQNFTFIVDGGAEEPVLLPHGSQNLRAFKLVQTEE